MTILLILGCLLGAWWLLLTIWAVRCYLERVEDAKTPLTPEEIEECREWEARHPHCKMQPLYYITGAPFVVAWILFLLPLCIYQWILDYRDPYDRHPSSKQS